MFQYAFGLSLSRRQKSKLYFDDSFFTSQLPGTDIALRHFQLDVFANDIAFADSKTIADFIYPSTIQKALSKLPINRKIFYKETSLKVDKHIFDISTPAYFEGYWQSEDYFKSNESLVRKALTFKKELNKASQELANELGVKDNTVSIHVRRSDYVSSERTNQIHGTCSANYYLNAINLLREKIAEPAFYIFSDDPTWVKQTLLPAIRNARLIAHNYAEDSWQDMDLMSRCRHHIIANSSFSWWGAWLNPYIEKIVVAPKNWFCIRDHYFDDTDIVPKSWIKLDND